MIVIEKMGEVEGQMESITEGGGGGTFVVGHFGV